MSIPRLISVEAIYPKYFFEFLIFLPIVLINTH